MTPMDNGIHKWDCFILHLGITTPACFACHDVGRVMPLIKILI